ncbi:MAG: hypothetical protein HY553_03000 [Elusimicrobia bacterium]|nr:hypothetical protein [Elusimicrobiota bacterium]
MSALALLLTLLPAWAWARERARPSLAELARAVRFTKACALVPAAHGESLPLPVRIDGELRYRLFFFPSGSDEGPAGRRPRVWAPSDLAEFAADGSSFRCGVEAALPKAGPDAPLGPMLSARAAKMTGDAYAAARERLLASLETAAAAFARAAPPDAAARAAAREFLDAFAILSEPGLRKHYRALSPEFWTWVEGAAKALE